MSYPYIKTLCNVGRFSSIDEAVRYLIDTMYWRGNTDFQVLLRTAGFVTDFRIFLNAFGSKNMLRMCVSLCPIHLSDFHVSVVAS